MAGVVKRAATIGARVAAGLLLAADVALVLVGTVALLGTVPGAEGLTPLVQSQPGVVNTRATAATRLAVCLGGWRVLAGKNTAALVLAKLVATTLRIILVGGEALLTGIQLAVLAAGVVGIRASRARRQLAVRGAAAVTLPGITLLGVVWFRLEVGRKGGMV